MLHIITIEHVLIEAWIVNKHLFTTDIIDCIPDTPDSLGPPEGGGGKGGGFHCINYPLCNFNTAQEQQVNHVCMHV